MICKCDDRILQILFDKVHHNLTSSIDHISCKHLLSALYRYGSAAYKASSYAIFSSAVYIAMYYYGTTQNPYWNISYGINASPQSNAWNMNNGGSRVNNNDTATEDVFQESLVLYCFS